MGGRFLCKGSEGYFGEFFLHVLKAAMDSRRDFFCGSSMFPSSSIIFDCVRMMIEMKSWSTTELKRGANSVEKRRCLLIASFDQGVFCGCVPSSCL